MATDQPVMAVRIVDSSNTVLETLGGAASPLTLTEAVGESALTLTGATQTSSFPTLTMTQTWNNAGTTFTAVKLDVTSTASAAASLLMDLQVGGSSKFSVDKSGNASAVMWRLSDVTENTGFTRPAAGKWLFTSQDSNRFYLNNTVTQIASNCVFGWAADTDAFTGVDTGISRGGAAGVIAIGNGTAADKTGTILAKTKAGAPGTGDVPDGTWALIRDTSGATTKLYYNNGGSLQSVALT